MRLSQLIALYFLTEPDQAMRVSGYAVQALWSRIAAGKQALSLLGNGALQSAGQYDWATWRGAKKSADQLRTGDILDHDGKIVRVSKYSRHHGVGRGQGFVMVDLTDVRTGIKIPQKLRMTDAFELLELEPRTFTVLYKEGTNVVLLDDQSFEQVEVSEDLFGDKKGWVAPELQVTCTFHNGAPVSALIPPRIKAVVVEVPDNAVKDSTASNRHVILDNGLLVSMPAHVQKGDEVVVRTEDNSFFSKVSAAQR